MYHALLVMKENDDTVHYNNETSGKAESLFKLIYDFESIVTLVVTLNILDYILPVTRKLQAKDLNVAQSMDLIQSLKLTIENLRNSVENYHENWYDKAKKLSRQKPTRQNFAHIHDKYIDQFIQFKTPKNIFSLTSSFLDHISADLEYIILEMN